MVIFVGIFLLCLTLIAVCIYFKSKQAEKEREVNFGSHEQVAASESIKRFKDGVEVSQPKNNAINDSSD